MALTFKLFTGKWCPSCEQRDNFVDQLCTKHDLNLEVHALEEAAARTEARLFHVESIPMVLVLDVNGDVIVRFGPHAREDQILKWLEERMSFDAESTRGTTKEDRARNVPRE